jgi:MFS family permease
LPPLLTALAAMFLQQTFASVGKVLPAVIAPLVIAELHADPAWVGVYYGISAAASLFAQMGCGSFIVRYGALRMSQVALVLLGGGMAAAAESGLPGFGASAIIGGGGAAVSTPTSSQLLGRVSPPRLAPLVFSIKQTAAPAGLLICGFLGPAVAGALGWRGAALTTAAACVVFAVMLQPLRARFDDDRVPSRRFRLSDFRTTIATVLMARDLRRLSFACLAFNGVQTVFTAYFVTYLVALGYDVAAAGFLFSLVVAVAVPCRVLWGWLGSFFLAPRIVMAGLALGMAGSVAVTGLFTAAWSGAAMGLVGAVLRDRDVVARHSLVGDRPPRARGQSRRSDRRRPVVRPDRRVPWPLCLLPAALRDRRLRQRLGRVRHSGFVGGDQSVAPKRASGTRRSPDSNDGRA